MARLAYNLDFTSPTSRVPVPTPGDCSVRRVLDDDIDSILDDNILDGTTPDMSSDGFGHRRESFADSAPAISPRNSGWNDFAFNPESSSLHASTNSGQLFLEQGNSFIHSEASRGPAFGIQQSAWHPSGSPGSCTPTTVYDGFPSDYENNGAAAPYGTDAAQSLHPSVYVGLSMGPAPAFQPNCAVSASPQSGQDWMSTSSSEHLEHRAMPKHAKFGSPSYQSNPPLLRRDGIRKKNARFEIPAERTLRTIDHLINQTSDEQVIKELKQQKRLLRNRQAALDSRQRKKQHTERLEEEKKHTSTIINELEEALGDMKIREAEWAREKKSWLAYNEHWKQQHRQLVMEKEELVRSHTIETGDLRKKNAFLIEQAQKLDSISMSTVPSSSGYSADFSDFDRLTMEASPWDNFSIANNFSTETEPRQETSLVVLPKKERSPSKDDDKSATSGLLLMLLLCGAWVASNNSPTLPAAIPRMPEDVRVASAAVLENIYKDAGLQPLEAVTSSNTNDVAFVKTSPTPILKKTTISGSEFASISHSPLASLHHQLVTPSAEQQRDQIFSLSADQYNGITSDDFFDESEPRPASRRTNLGEALSAMRNNKQGSAAEIYTRSLMWDEVPANVVRDFARMVAECNPGVSRQEPMT